MPKDYIQGINPFGETWYVAASGNRSSGAYGKSTENALSTFERALALASDGDTIVLGPGTHNVAAQAAMKAQLHIVAAVPSFGGKPTAVLTNTADTFANLLTVDVSGVVFEDIEFKIVAGGATAVQLFDISQTTAVSGLTFKNCWFNLNSVDKAGKVVALAVDDATNATTGLCLKNCRFLGGDATTGQAVYIDVGVGGIPDALIEDNVFALESADGDARALNFADPGTGAKSYAFVVRNNDFIGPTDKGSDAVPIIFAGAMTEDEIVAIIRTNYFSNCSATPITQDKVNGSLVSNYVGDNATGGTLVDPGT